MDEVYQRELERYLENPLNQEIYFNVPVAYSANDESKHTYFRLLFGLLRDVAFKHTHEELEKLVYNRLSLEFSMITEITSSDTMVDIINHLKKHAKQIVESRMDQSDPSIQFVLNVIQHIDISKIPEYKTKDEFPILIFMYRKKGIKITHQIEGSSQEKPKEYFQEDNDAMKKVLLLIELGIIDFLKDKYGTNDSQTFRILQVLTGMPAALIKRYRNGFIVGMPKKNKKVFNEKTRRFEEVLTNKTNRSNPATPKNIEWITNLLSENKINKK
jgi:hypothetical protein